MDKTLVQKALWNSGLLAAVFFTNMGNDLFEGRFFWALIAAAAAAITAKDAVVFYKASKQ